MEGASRFGVLIGEKIVEKPKDIEKGDVVTGLYVYPNDVFDLIKTLKPSTRGEIEITSVNNFYLKSKKCEIYHMKKDNFWSDCGIPKSLFETIKWIYEKL
jgi:glucose-1-phosphate thymidylyltransferase